MKIMKRDFQKIRILELTLIFSREVRIFPRTQFNYTYSTKYHRKRNHLVLQNLRAHIFSELQQTIKEKLIVLPCSFVSQAYCLNILNA